jgi:hypothetical protein
MRKLLSFSWSAGAVLFVVGCGGVSGPPTPKVIPGGGVADGKIDGNLFVHVTDEETRTPLSSASVRVGEASDPAPCTVLTDSTGLARFEPDSCPSLKGPVMLTVSANAYAPATWIGVNATNVTLPLRPMNPPAVDSASVSGTIAGWAAMPAPATNHQTLALIGYSQSNTLGDRANEIPQGTRKVRVLLTDVDIPGNLCVINALVSNCDWQLKTRTGAQAIIGIIVDQFTNGTDDEADDTFTVTGYAMKRGLNYAANDSATGVTLEMIADTDMQTFTASFPSLPSGMDYMGAFPALELGEEGRIAFTTPALDMARTTTRVPKLAGALANAHYSLIAQAQDSMEQSNPSSLAWVHQANVGGTVAVPSWLAPPSNISFSGGTYSFSAVAGATIQGGEILNMAGQRVWSITVFDKSTSFTLPGLSPDPLPVGMLTFEASAMQIPGTDVNNFKIDDVRDKITAISNDVVTFTR